MAKMTPEECRGFLLAQARTGKLATVRADGRPHIAPIWFDLDGETIVFNTGETTVKARNIQHDARISLCVDDDRPPFTYVQVEGTAVLSEEMEELRYWAARIAGRYMGADQAEAYGRRNAVPGELVVRITPTHWHGEKNIAD
jgi:PPOX class probable F420-dependent enzyme